jgi:hypothetical protein
MEKLFISCPMRARTAEQIHATMDRMHKIAEAIFGEELEVIPTYFEGTPPVLKMPMIVCGIRANPLRKCPRRIASSAFSMTRKLMMAASSRTMSPNSTAYRSIW